MTEPLNYANVACVACGTPYWYGPLEHPDIEDFGETVAHDVCPKCGSYQRRPWPNVSLKAVTHDKYGNIL